jgi:hypothetical protein
MSDEDLLRHCATQDMAWRMARLERIAMELATRTERIDAGWGKRLNDLRKRFDAQYDHLAEKLKP